MIDDHDIADDKALSDMKATTSFLQLCNGISKLDGKIAGALAIKNGKVLAASEGAGSALPSDEYLSKLISQAQIFVGIPLVNRAFFGDYNFTIVSYETLEIILFYLKNQKVIIGIGIIPPYDRDETLEKIQTFLKRYPWHSATHSITE